MTALSPNNYARGKEILESLLLPLSAEDEKRLYSELAEGLCDPGFPDKCPILPDNHKLRLESQIVSDAFEAVTNGMDNPEAMEKLEGLAASSALFPFKALTMSLRYLYIKEYALCRKALDTIPDNSPPSFLKTPLNNLIERRKTDKTDSPNIIREMLSEHLFISGLWNQFSEAADNGMEPMLESLHFILGEIKKRNPDSAKGFFIYVLKKCASEDGPLSQLLHLSKDLFGVKESYRLFAVAFMEDEPDTSLLFLLSYGISSVRQREMDFRNARVLLFLADYLYSDPGFRKEYISEVGQKLTLFLKETDYIYTAGASDLRRISIINDLGILRQDFITDRGNENTRRFRRKDRETQPVKQLELFI